MRSYYGALIALSIVTPTFGQAVRWPAESLVVPPTVNLQKIAILKVNYQRINKDIQRLEAILVGTKNGTLVPIYTSQVRPYIKYKVVLPSDFDTWLGFSAKERDSLRARWTKEKVAKVVRALKGEDSLPDFVGKLLVLDSFPNKILAGYDLQGIPLEGKDLENVDFHMAHLQEANFSKSNLKNANFQNAELYGANLQEANLLGANLQEAKLDSANLQNATLDYASLRKAELVAANLKEATLHRADLQEVNAGGVDFQKAFLWDANLESAYLWGGNLQEAYLYGVNLKESNLWRANLQYANLRNANLYGADLEEANLRKANLTEANLQGANLLGSRFDSTYLWRTNLGEAKNIRYIVWGDTLQNRYFIGEETDSRLELRKMFLRYAEITYRDLKSLYKKEGLDDIANAFNIRENEVKTKRSEWLVRIVRLLFFKLTYGYGSRPLWLLWYSLGVVAFFTLIFVLLTIFPNCKSGVYIVLQEDDKIIEKILKWQRGKLLRDCLYFSFLSFCTFGYGTLQPRQWVAFFRLYPIEYKPVRLARIFVGIEAIFGIYIFALLVTVLFGRG